MGSTNSSWINLLGKNATIILYLDIVFIILVRWEVIKSELKVFLWILVIVYILYLIFEFLSPTCKFLRNINNSVDIYKKLGTYFQTPPCIELTCECFHYKKIKRTKKRGGNSDSKKIVTYRETAYLTYYSARDISGLFKLNCNKSEVEGKDYIQLELKPEINFADPISYMDYEILKNEVYSRNVKKDIYMDFKEKRTIPDMSEFNFIKLKEESTCVNFKFFIIFTIFSFAEFFKCYFESVCVHQKFTIRKLISTRFNLMNYVQFEHEYDRMAPALDLFSIKYTYGPEMYNYVNQNIVVRNPSMKEMQDAKQYENRIPKYEIDSKYYCLNGEVKIGIVKESRTKSSRNKHSSPVIENDPSRSMGSVQILNLNRDHTSHRNLKYK